MSRDDFDALIRRLEPFAAKFPRCYFLRVAVLAGLGYVFWLLILGLLLAVGVGLGVVMFRYPSGATLKLVLVAGLFVAFAVGVILKAVCVRIEPPEGFEVDRAGSPELFSMLDQVSAELEAPRFHHVILTGDYNAAVVQVPRFGVLGGQRNYLLLGLPLMQGLSPERFRAVLAHELGHLSGNHSRFSCWIYRVRKTWTNILTRMQQNQNASAGLFLRFFQWYAPYFNAFTFVLARSNEYSADACAAESAGVQTTAEALICVKLHGRFLDESFWPEQMRLSCHEAEPPMGAFMRTGQALQDGFCEDAARRWLRQALLEQTSNADTHPCLTDRLRSIGFLGPSNSPANLKMPAPPTIDAARHLLGEALPACRRALEIRWENGVRQQWHSRFKQAEKNRQRLVELQSLEQKEALTDDETFERACLVLELDGQSAALPWLRSILHQYPDHTLANFTLGRLLLEAEDGAGVKHLEKGMDGDVELVHPGCDLLYRYFRRHGDREQLRALEIRYDNHEQTLRLSREERQNLAITDTFIYHGLSAKQLGRLRDQLRDYTQIVRVHLVRKELTFSPQKRFFVMCVEVLPSWVQGEADQRLIDRLVSDLRLPGEALIFSPLGTLEPLGRIIRLQTWALLYERPPQGQAQAATTTVRSVA